MTAEIAILNRSALALAADSAVTIRIGARIKIYDSAEKILELSRTQPLALMLYNNVEFAGVPLDILVRKFRNEHARTYSRVSDAATAFLEYLRKFPRGVEDERSYLFQVLLTNFTKLRRDYQRSVQRMLVNHQKADKTDNIADRIRALFSELIEKEIEKERAAAIPKFLKGKTLSQFRERYSEAIEAAARSGLNSIIEYSDANTREKLEEYAFALVKSSNKSDVFTGIVVGGFATKDIFPTLTYCEIDGVYFDELKFLEGTVRDIDRRGEKAAMVPFAQQEMAERFIFGLDSKLERHLSRFVAEAAETILNTKKGAFSDKEKVDALSVVNDKFSSMLSGLKDNARNSILDVVSFMSKKELAEMAHALVELTSKKRRFSAEQETVGGPIDVAIITKNEGLIWIQRKHYFDTELNQNYLVRQQREPTRLGGQGNARTAKAATRKPKTGPAA